jgi:RHS repeat-associated protein
LSGSTTQEIGAIALGLRQNLSAEYKDANGNLKVTNGRWIAYDEENRPVKVITPDAAVTTFVYDFEGNRVKKTITQGSQSDTSVYIGTLYEVNPTETIRYIYAGSQRVALKKNTGAVEYFLPDHLGGTHRIADSNGNIVRTTSYQPFGSTYQTSGTQDDDHKFTGQRLDDTTGLYYYGARYYDPAVGRFITPDTIMQAPYDPQALNRYVYCRNNPIIYVDPSGHSWLSDFVDKNSEQILGVGLQALGGPIGQYAGGYLLSKSETGRNILAGEIVAVTAVVTAMCGGCGAGASAALWGALSGEIVGGYSAYQGGGDILSGVAVGGAIGGVTGYYGGVAGNAVKASLGTGKLGFTLSGAARGAIIGAGSGGIAGFRGGAGNLTSILQGAAWGAMVGGVLGGAMGYLQSTPPNATPLEDMDSANWLDTVSKAGNEAMKGISKTDNLGTVGAKLSLKVAEKLAVNIGASLVRRPEIAYNLIPAVVGVESTHHLIFSLYRQNGIPEQKYEHKW